ncbi:MAG: PQQ-binding-like beta-propeller repeat protein [Pirellulales bacterium]
MTRDQVTRGYGTAKYEAAFVGMQLLVLVGLLMGSTAHGAESATKNLANQMLESIREQSGLCVHLGFHDVRLTTQLSNGGKFLVHGLSNDSQAVEKGRKTIRAQGLAGAVSIEHHSLNRLPYADNLVNLMVVENLANLSAQGYLMEEKGNLIEELLRVLRPGGSAFVKESALSKQRLLAKSVDLQIDRITIGSSTWYTFHKQRPDAMDEWTHRRYDPTRNAVSHDQVNVPSGVRWIAGPNWPTGHRKASVPGVVASKDRLVYVFDDLLPAGEDLPVAKGKTLLAGGLPEERQKTLIARDAYNGMLLWKRTTSNEESPVLVHMGNRVYNVVEDNGPLVVLDARTGEVIQTYHEAGSPLEVFALNGRLLIRTQSDVRCLDLMTGKLHWTHEGAYHMVASKGSLFLHTDYRAKDGRPLHRFIGLDLANGHELWQTTTEKWPSQPNRLELVLYQDDILVFGGSGNHAITAKDGSYLWSYNYDLIGHGGSYSKVAYMHGLLWIHNGASAAPDEEPSNAWEGLDPQTGEVKKRLAHGVIKHRCMYDVATEQYFLCGSMDFVNLEQGKHTRFTAARNSCRTAGVVPANGLIYTFPHACACYPLMRGFLGLSGDAPVIESVDLPASQRLQGGPAMGTDLHQETTSESQWPTYRADVHRSASTKAFGPTRLDKLWSRTLTDVHAARMRQEWDQKDGGRVTSPVVADGMVFAAASDMHELFALDAETGTPKWTFVAGGRIDCPPTVYRGLCLFGSRDGWVYCLRSHDGKLVWRYRAAPDDRRIVAYGQLESRWPVVGGVLIYDGLAYFAAGRHAGSDGGVHVYAAEPASGKIVWHSNPEGYQTLPDLLVAADDEVHMADWQFDAKTGKDSSSTSGQFLRSARLGLLNNAWYKRPIALRKNLQQWSIGQTSGQLLSFSQKWICGFRGPSKVSGGDGKVSGFTQLFAKPHHRDGQGWSEQYPLGTNIKSLVLAGETLFIAGRLNGYDEKSYGVRALSVQDGKPLAEVSVDDPLVHDCLSVANGHVYLTTQGGQVICLGDR